MTFAPCLAAARTTRSAVARFAARSPEQANWVAASVTFMASERGWRGGRDDLTRLVADVTEAVRHGAGEIVRVARPEHAALRAHGQLDAAHDDHAALFALVTEHVRARVGLRPIALVHDRHRAVRPLRRD